MCREQRKGRQDNESRELASIATEGLAKVAMHAGRWQAGGETGMEESQIIQVHLLR